MTFDHPMVFEGFVDRKMFDEYIKSVLCPCLRPGDIVIMDNLSAHKSQDAYDANKLLALAERQNHEVVIPPTSGRLIQRGYDIHVYKERHLVECFFAKLKSFRRIATRYDKLAITFKAVVMLAACLIWPQ